MAALFDMSRRMTAGVDAEGDALLNYRRGSSGSGGEPPKNVNVSIGWEE